MTRRALGLLLAPRLRATKKEPEYPAPCIDMEKWNKYADLGNRYAHDLQRGVLNLEAWKAFIKWKW